MSITCLNMGCGHDIQKSSPGINWLNLDIQEIPGIDITADCEKPLPLEDNSVDMISASHIMEHIHNFKELMLECWRILKPKGLLHIKVPEFPCRAAIADPTHVRYFVPETFYHFSDKSDNSLDSLHMKDKFRLLWLESVQHDRPSIDDSKVGTYFTEIWVDLEKVSDN